MSHEFQFALLDEGRSLLDFSFGSDTAYVRHSGALLSPIMATLTQERRTWVAVSVRTGVVKATLTYEESTEVFYARAGEPLLLMTREIPETATFESDGSEVAIAEILVTPGAQAEEVEFLVLNAGAGVRRGVASASENVMGWRDVRPESGAPLEWTQGIYLGNGSRLIQSDPDFNGHASVIWEHLVNADDETYGSAGYVYPEQAGLWDFLGPEGEFLWMAILKPPVDTGGINVIFALHSVTQGIRISIDSGYRIHIESTGDSPIATVVDEVDRDEVIEDGTAMVLMVRQSLTDGIDVYLQGRWRHISDAVAPSPAGAGTVRPVVGFPASSLGSNMKIADLRIWKNLPNDEQAKIDAYLAMAADYNVNDTQRQGHPFVTGSFAMLRANRGVVILADTMISNKTLGTSFVGDAVDSWYDTRPESVLSFGTGDQDTKPARELAPSLDNHPVIHAYGGSPAGGGDENGHRMLAVLAEGEVLPLLTSDFFTILLVLEPTAGIGGTYKGGVIMATNGAAAVETFLLQLTSAGALRLFMSTDSETDVDVTLPIGEQVFGHALAVMARIGGGSVQLSAHDLVTNEGGTISEETEWPGGIATLDPLKLFDYDAYYGATQWYEGLVSELTISADRESSEDIDRWLTYVKRRYGAAA